MESIASDEVYAYLSESNFANIERCMVCTLLIANLKERERKDIGRALK